MPTADNQATVAAGTIEAILREEILSLVALILRNDPI